MPIYEYVCQDCGKRFEALILGREKPQCPKCESEKLAKQFSAFAVHGSSKGEDDWGGDFDAGDACGPGGDCGPDMGGMGMGGMGMGPCGSCGDPRGPGACGLD